MLEIQNVEILSEKDLNIKKRKTKKSQILLYDTKRRIGSFIMMLKHRRNGKYENIPHFIVTKSGEVFKIFNPDYYSTTFNNIDIDKKQIKIAIENLGWLKKNTITGVLNNWINEPYRGENFINVWRGYHFWDVYTNQQLVSLKNLLDTLCNEYKIPNKMFPSSGFIKNVSNFNGIVCKSNFQTIYNDINPSFNYKFFNNETKYKERI